MKNHGLVAWGKDALSSVYHAVIMEKVTEMDLKTILITPAPAMQHYILDKHYIRKYVPNAYYV